MDPNDNRDFPDSFGQGDSINDNLGVEKITGIPTIDKVQKTGYTPTITSRSKVRELEDEAKRQAQLDVATGVAHVLDDSPKEDYTSTKELFKKTLGVTEYDEIRNKLHLNDDESFTDYYNRSGGYVPEGYETQAKLLLAEEKRKMLYAEVEAGNMSEEDFLYEAYGKDLLKQEGIDFESKLYWYQRMKNTNDPTRFEDPRDNAVFMEDLIKNARALFQQESWYRDASTANILDMSKYVTGEVLDAASVAELFPDFFEQMSGQYEQIEKLIKYYRGGLLSGFNPTIDADGDGKVDYYYAPDGKLYNVNETGKGANTMRAVYNDDGSLNRIVRQDTYAGEFLSEFADGLSTIFTDLVDLGALAVGAVVDIFDGGDFGDTVAEFHANTQQFWNSIPVIGDQEYVVDSGWKTSDGKANWANYGRQGINLVGAIVPAVVISIFTAGAPIWGSAIKEGVETGAVVAAKETAEAVVKKIAKESLEKAGKEATEEAIQKWMLKKTGQELLEKEFKKSMIQLTGKEVAEDITQRALNKSYKQAVKNITTKELGEQTFLKGLKQKTKAAGRFVLDTAVSLTKYQNGFGGTGWGARIGSATMVAVKDTLSTTAVLKINQERLGLTNEEVIGRSLALGGIDLVSGILLRSVGDSAALGDLASLSQKTSRPVSEVFQNGTVKGLFAKIATGSLSNKGLVTYGVTNAAMDLLDNLLTATAQTTLTQTHADDMGWNAFFSSLGNVLNSPQFAMNMVYQSYQNFKDVKHISSQKIMQASTDAYKMDTTVRSYFKNIQDRFMAEGKVQEAEAVAKLLIEYDKSIINYTNTKNVELEETLAKKASKKTTNESETESSDTETQSTIIPNYSKGEAIILAISDLIENKLSLDSDHDLVVALRNHFNSKVNTFITERTKHIFRQVNADHNAYITMATNTFKGIWANIWYGKAARDLQSSFHKAMYQYYYRGPQDPRSITGNNQENVVAQLMIDLQEEGEIFKTVWENVDKTSEDVLNFVKPDTLTSLITAVQNEDGTTKVNKRGNIIYEVADEKHAKFYKKYKKDIVKFLKTFKPGEEVSLKDIIWLDLNRTGEGGEKGGDGSKHREKAVTYLNAVYDMWNDILGAENNPLYKIDETNYFLKPSTLSGTMKNMEKIGLFISGATSLKLALAGKVEPAKVKSALQTLFIACGSTKRKKEFDVIIEENIKSLPKLLECIVDGKTITKSDAAAILNYVEGFLEDYNLRNKGADGKQKKEAHLPEDFKESSVYNEALLLKKFMKEYGDLQDILRARKPNETLTDSELKTINSFIKSYSTQSSDGNYTNSEILTLAYDEGLIGEKHMDAIVEIRNFILGKVDTSLESVKLQGKEQNKSSVNNIDVEQMKQFIVNQFVVEEYPLNIKVPTKKGSESSSIQVLFKDIGSEIGYKQYLSSLGKDPEDIDIQKQYVGDYGKAVMHALGTKRVRKGVYYPILDLIETAVNPNASADDRVLAKQNLDLQLKSKYDNSDILNKELSHINIINKTQKHLNNRTNMITIDLNILSSYAGTRVYGILEGQNPTKAKALSKAKDMQTVLDILFSTKDEQLEFMRGIATIERLKETYGGYNLEIPINSALFNEIIVSLGYHPRVITSLTKGELYIPGIYFNNNNEGVIIANKNNAMKILEPLKKAIDTEKKEKLISGIKFRNPVDIIEDVSGLATLVRDDVALHPEAIILNSIKNTDEFKEAVVENFNLIATSIKQGKNAGSIFKYILSSVKGYGISGENDTNLDKIIKSYKVITAFSELFDSKSKAKFGIQLMSKEAADTLKATYGENTCFLFTDNDEGYTEVTINPTATKEQFLDIALKRLKHGTKYVKGLNSLVPLEVMRDAEGRATSKYKMPTRYENTDIVSAYTTISWLAYKLQNDMDVYSFVTEYESDNLNIRKTDLSDSKYKEALAYLDGKSKADVISDSELSDNIFVQMQKTAYAASSELREVFLEALYQVIDDNNIDVDIVAEVLGNQNHRRDLAKAIQTVLTSKDFKDSLKLESGFIEITDEFAQKVLDNLTFSTIKMSKDYADIRGVALDEDTKMNIISGSQFSSFNPETSELQLSLDNMKELLKLLPLEYSVLSGESYYSINTKLLAMIQSASHIEDGSLAISSKDLYELDDNGFNRLLELVESESAKKDLQIIRDALQQSSLYNARHSERRLETRLSNIDIKEPSKISTTGDIVETDSNGNLDFTGEQYKAFNLELDRMIHNAKISKAKEQYVKFSSLMDSKFSRCYEMQNIAKLLELNVLPFTDHPASLELQNLMIEENLYYLYNNLVDFSNALISEYSLDGEKAMNIAFNYYLYSTGMQMQGAHPEFLMIDTKSGKVVDIAISGSRGDRNSGLITRLYNNYFESKKDGTGLQFKESFKHTINGVETIEVNPKNLIAIRLDTNVISTTFKPADFNIEVYDIGNHEAQFINMFADKIAMVARAHSLDITDISQKEELELRVNQHFYTEEYGNIIGQKRKLLNKAKDLIWDPENLNDGIDTLSSSSSDLNKQEVEWANQNNENRVPGTNSIAEQKENDALRYGVTKRGILKTPGMIEYIDNSNKKLIKHLINESDNAKLTILSEELDTQTTILRGLELELDSLLKSKVTEEDIETLKTSNHPAYQEIKDTYDRIVNIQKELPVLRTSLKIATTQRKPILEEMSSLHALIEGDNPQVLKGTPEYSANARRMREDLKPKSDKLLSEILPTREKLKGYYNDLPEAISKLEALYKKHKLKDNPSIKGTKTYSKNSERIKGNEATGEKGLLKEIEETRSLVVKARNEKDSFIETVTKNNRKIKDTLDLYEEGRSEDFVKAVSLLASTKEAKEDLARKMLIEHIRRDKSVEADLFKFFGYDFDKFKNRKFESTVRVNNKYVKVSELLNKPFVIIDSEVLYTKGKDSHVYEVSIIYYDGKNKPVKATKYIPYTVDDGNGGRREVNTIKELRLEFKEFFENYYDIHGGSKLSISRLLKKKSSPEFDDLLTQANNIGATLIGFNSKEFDIPHLTKSKILSETDHINLLTNAVDLFDIVKSPVHNLNLYGGKATLVAIAEQLGIKGLDKLKKAHLSDADNEMVVGVLKQIIQDSKISYESELINKLEDLYKTIFGIDSDLKELPDFIKDTFKDLALDETEYKATSNMQALKTHVDKILIDADNSHFSKVAELIGILNEIDVMNKSNTLIRYLNKTINKTVNKYVIDFADTFSNPETKNALIDCIAFLTKDIDFENANDRLSLAKQCDKTLTSIAFDLAKFGDTGSTTDKGLITALVKNKSDIYKMFGIDTSSEAFKDWKNSKQYKSHAHVEKMINTAYGKGFGSELPVENAKSTVAFGLNNITKMVENFSFLSDEQKNFITDLSTNFYDYSGDYKDFSHEGLKVNALSNHDKHTIDWLMTDPLLTSRDVGIYRKATATSSPVTLKRTDANGNPIRHYPKNMTVYLSEQGYRDLMGYGKDVPIDYNNINDYVGVIRYPVDKFDSMHYLKLEIIEDGGNLDTVITVDTMLALNGDLDGDNIEIIRPDKIQSVYGAKVKNAGKYNSYELLDTITELAMNSSTRNIHKDTESIKEMYKISLDDKVANDISTLLNHFNKGNKGAIIDSEGIERVVDYAEAKKIFIEKYKDQYSEKLLEDIFIKEPSDLSSLVYGNKGIVYVSYLPNSKVLKNNSNIIAKRLILLANASKHGVIAFNDTQTGMLQKSFNNIDWSVFEDLDLIDNAIRISGTTNDILNEIPSDELYSLLINSNDKTIKKLANKFKNILKDPNGKNSDKVELLLRVNQLRTLKSQDYKDNIISAVDELRNSSKDSKFVAAMNRYMGIDNSQEVINKTGVKPVNELTFFKSIQELAAFQKLLNGMRIKGSKNNKFMEVIMNLCPEYDDSIADPNSEYNPGKEIPMFFSFSNDINVAEDQIQWTKWTSEKADNKGRTITEHHGSDKLKHISASNTKALNTSQLNRLAKYKKLDLMTPADVRALNISFNERCNYYFVETNNGIATVIRAFNIDTAKVMQEGNINTKSTPARTIDLDKDIKSKELAEALKKYNVCAMFKYKSAMGKPEKISARYIPGDHILIDANGNETKSIEDAIGFIDPKARINVLENTLLNKAEAKEVKLEDSAYGNNMLSTGGIGATHGIFVTTDKDGNKVLEFDNKKYIATKKAIRSLSEYDRYATDAKDLYEHLAVACILDSLDSTDSTFKGKTKSEFFDDLFNRGQAKEFIKMSLSSINPEDLHGKAKKILTLDMFNKIYGIDPSGIEVPSNTSTEELPKLGNMKNIIKTSEYYNESPEYRGINSYYYDLERSPNESTLDFINDIRLDDEIYISADAAKRAEQASLLLNKKIERDTKASWEFENTSDKTSQPVGQRTTTSGSNDYLENPNPLANYRSKYKFEIKGKHNAKYTKAPIITDSSIFKDSKEYLGGKRLSKLLASVVNTKGTYKDRDDILTAYNDDISIINSMHFSQRYFTKEGGIKQRARRADLTQEGFKNSSISEYRDDIYNQRRSPMFWQGVKELSDENKFESVYNYDTTDTRTTSDFVQEDYSDSNIQASFKKLNTDTTKMAQYKDIVNRFTEELNSLNNITKDLHSDFISGSLVGAKQFRESRFDLNFGGKLDDEADLMQNRSLRQIFVDQQNTKRQLDSEFTLIKNLCANNDCAEDLQLYAYVLTLNARLKSDSTKFNEDIKYAKEELTRLGINNPESFLKDFEVTHKEIAIRFTKFINQLNEMSSKYSLDSNEPTHNIFRLLATKVHPNKKGNKADMDNFKKWFKSGAPRIEQIGQGEKDLANYTINYNNYNLFTNLDNTINEVSRRAAILAHSERLKRDGVIDSTTIQNLLAKEFSDPEITKLFTDPEISPAIKNEESISALIVVVNRLADKFADDEQFITELYSLKELISNNGRVGSIKLNVGELNLELFRLLSEKTSSYKMSLDKALEIANTTGSPEADKVIYAYKQMQDIYASLIAINPKAGEAIAKSILNYAEKNNLALVDQHGREFNQDFVYAMSETSLEYLPKVLEQKIAELSHPTKGAGYNTFLVMQMLGGNAFFMDKGLTNILGKQVFIQKPKSGFEKAFQKSAGWCVKMLMASPFKLVDRFIKFTLFDVATLSSANHRTLLKQGEAYKDLRAFFASKGGYSSDNLKKFIDTQGISFDGVNFDGLLTGDPESSTGGLFRTYTNKVGDVFTFQTLSQRYAYWLATKEAIENGDYSVAGSAYHLRKQMELSNLTPEEQASFMMSQMLGSTNDFPSISKSFNKYGFVFTTFPLAAMRYGIGELRSAGAAIHDLFTEGSRLQGAKWLARNSAGVIGTLLLEQFIVNTIASMYGVDEDDEEKEEWEKIGALPNVTQTLIQGQPIMDTFSSMNPNREILGLFVDTTSKDGEDENKVDGLTRFIRKNILSHIHPVVKAGGELALQKDLIDDQLIDTKDKYNGLENMFRKASAYFIGASGANALVKTFQQQGYENLPSTFKNGLSNAINAELGNTKATKENKKNYYKALSILNEYLYSDTQESQDVINNNENFNYARYNEVKSKIYPLINREASTTEIYSEITKMLESGYTLQEIRAAFKNCSISGKLSKITNYHDFIESISEADLQNIKTAIAYEGYILPWLDESVGYLTKQINQQNVNPSYYQAPYYYKPNGYINNYEQPSYSRPVSSDNYRKRNADVYNSYNEMLEYLRNAKQQAEYEANQKKWSDD